MVNYHSKTQKLKEIFLSDLTGGRFRGDGPVPSALHLSELYGVSRNTIRRMLSELAEEGILLRSVNNRFAMAAVSRCQSDASCGKLQNKAGGGTGLVLLRKP